MFRENIIAMEEYKPPIERRSEGYLLLDFNERTIPPPIRIRSLLREYSERGSTNRYPEYGDLDNVVGNYAGVRSEQVMLTNGSDQGIDIIFRATIDKGDKVIIPSPSFTMFNQSAAVQGSKIFKPRYEGERLSFPLNEVLYAIDRETSLIVICNPNNPTGTIVPKEDVEKIVSKAKKFEVAVLVDEAYHEFNPSITVKDLLNTYDNLFLTRTFSKVLGIAAIRAGYVMSQKENISQLRKIRGPYDCNMLVVSVLRGLAYKDTIEEMTSYVREVMEEAKPKTETFLIRNGMRVYPSGANFLLVNPSPFSSEEIYQFLKSYRTRQYKGVLVRPREDPPNTFRVSIGTKENMEIFIEALTEFLKTKSQII